MVRFLSSFLFAFFVFGAANAQTIDVARFVDPISARSASLSPDGSHLAYILRTDNDERVIVVDLAAGTGRPIQRITREEGSYDWVGWKNNTRLLIGVELVEMVAGRVIAGSHRHRADQEMRTASVIALNRDGSGFVQMFDGQIRRSLRGSTFLLDPLQNDSSSVLLMAEDNAGRSVWRADVNTGRAERVARGSEETFAYATDGAGYPVIRMDFLADNSGYRVFRRASGAEEWLQVLELRRAAAAANSPNFIIGSGPGANEVYVLASEGQSDLASIYLYNTATGDLGAPLFTPRSADAYAPWVHPATRAIIATCEFAQRLQCASTDPTVQRHIGAIDSFFERQATFYLVDASQDGNRWLLAVNGPTEPGAYYLFDRTTPRISPVANMYPSLVDGAVSPVEVVSYRAQDGTALWAYVTARAGASGPRPMIVMPHGGPEARDYYGYDAFAQFLASRGYIVVQPNFRGSDGFGRAFADAGRGQWGRLMQDDVTDAVRHMISTGRADPQRVCIVGASYGGYAALAGASMTPDLYRCAVSIAGLSDLPEFVLRTSERGSSGRSYWLRSIGDPGSNREALDAISPRHLASQIRIPVLLIHGEEDDVVELRQSQLMEQAMDGRARLVRLPDEGHIWDDWTRESRLTTFREVEAFLRQHNPP
ncbi:MAG TPA: S9 family peptidase [Vitreimonas sp.]|jgi:dipeptidyl aminopeptidase/acylaminoacyl peptidase|nr:S9 family peptidase [Vitreimonas sp.]